MKCPTCDGKGLVLDADAAHDMRQVRDQCPDCGGSGDVLAAIKGDNPCAEVPPEPLAYRVGE